MKKLLTLILSCILVLSLVSCNSDKTVDESQKDSSATSNKPDEKTIVVKDDKDKDEDDIKFDEITEDITVNVENEDDFSKTKEEIAALKKEIQEEVSKVSEEDSGAYDFKQISIFMLEEAVNAYEEAKKANDNEKMEEALESIEMAKSIWSSEYSE